MAGDRTRKGRLEALDRCLDALLAGRPWRRELEEDPKLTEELEPLIGVAARFLDAAHHLHPPKPERRARLWRRAVAGSLGNLRGRASRWFSTSSVGAERLQLRFAALLLP